MDGFRTPPDLRVEELRARYGDVRSAEELLDLVIHREFPGRIALVSSFGAESAILLDLVARVEPSLPVIFLDTGKLFPETLAYRRELVERLGLTDVRTERPRPGDLRRDDPDGDLWEDDPDACCELRKTAPLQRALGRFDAWITGRKRYHRGPRENLPPFEVQDGWVKVNPLARWSPEAVGRAFEERRLPLHPLTARGYRSIGCAPCTGPVAPDQPVRAGRWPRADKTECGIHLGARRCGVGAMEPGDV